jgi:predicted Fe-Mo cluster-binding NifX family protein
MNSNVIIEVCKTHTPNKAAISVVAHSFENAEYFTFCEVCEQNIDSFCFYDDDRGIVYSKWSVSK